MKRIIKQVEFPAEAPKLTRVAAYARVSSGKDAMLHSLSAQVSYYSDLIQKHPGWQYCGVYADEALTGTKDTRENFQRLLNDCRAGKIDLIITKSISRFARNTVTLLETVRELKLLGINVYFEEQNIYALSADGELMMTILASYAQEESRSASENQKWRIRSNFQNGLPWNGLVHRGRSLCKSSRRGGFGKADLLPLQQRLGHLQNRQASEQGRLPHQAWKPLDTREPPETPQQLRLHRKLGPANEFY